MIFSMTGFGMATKQILNKKITVELKTLNSKQLDLNVRVPSMYNSKELDIRSLISKSVFRGKIYFNLNIENTAGDASSSINKPTVNAYIAQLKEIYDSATEQSYLEMAMKLSGTIEPKKRELDDDEWKEVLGIIKKTIENLTDYRKSEGVSLHEELTLRIENISSLLEEISKYENERISTVKERILKNIETIKINVDDNRFEQEMIFYIEKFDITEEKTRLRYHLEYFKENLEGSDVAGKKLGFISQEIGREINTLGSKSNHSEMQRIVVMMKDELEKIKEQVLNVL